MIRIPSLDLEKVWLWVAQRFSAAVDLSFHWRLQSL